MVALVVFNDCVQEETDSGRAYWFISLILDSDLCGVVVYTDGVLLMVNRWSTSPEDA